MHEVIEIIRNEGLADLVVVIEPWGMPLRLPAGSSFRVVVRGPQPVQLELVRRQDAVIVYAWPGATASVFDGAQLLHEFLDPVPPVTPGKSVKQFLDLMGFRLPPSDA